MSLTRRQKEDQNLWNFLASAFFLIVLVVVLWQMHTRDQGFPHAIPVLDMVLLLLAAMRVTRLVVYDKIMRWFRELFAETIEYAEDGITYIEVRPFGNGFRHTVYDLLNCPWCIGFWSSIIMVFCYYMFPWAWFIILFLAIAGASSFLQVTANAVGWKAENLKLDALSKEN